MTDIEIRNLERAILAGDKSAVWQLYILKSRLGLIAPSPELVQTIKTASTDIEIRLMGAEYYFYFSSNWWVNPEIIGVTITSSYFRLPCYWDNESKRFLDKSWMTEIPIDRPELALSFNWLKENQDIVRKAQISALNHRLYLIDQDYKKTLEQVQIFRERMSLLIEQALTLDPARTPTPEST